MYDFNKVCAGYWVDGGRRDVDNTGCLPAASSAVCTGGMEDRYRSNVSRENLNYFYSECHF